MQIDPKYRPLLLEALEELMYKVSLRLDKLKGEPMTPNRRALTEKQAEVEALQHLISTAG